MTDSTIVQSLEHFAREPDSVLTGALIVSRIIDPETDADWCLQQLRDMAEAMPLNADAAAIAAALQQQGFRGSQAYYKSENSALTYVLSSREGIPISLAVVMLSVCEQLGLEASGVNFPSHFLVASGQTLIDPFTMSVADPEQCRAWLESNGLDPEAAFVAASPQEIVLRMLNNLSALARSTGDSARALELSDYKLAVMPGVLPVYQERVELWLELGVVDMARRDLRTAIELAADDATRAQLFERLSALDDVPSRLN
jgi:regulator of sirC expression with transglutaminase-like and TPR domain